MFVSRSRRLGRDGSGRLHTRSALRMVADLGPRVGVRCWPHALRHAAISKAVERGQRAGFRPDQLRAYSRHRQLAAMLVYMHERNRAATQREITHLVAGALTAA